MKKEEKSLWYTGGILGVIFTAAAVAAPTDAVSWVFVVLGVLSFVGVAHYPKE